MYIFAYSGPHNPRSVLLLLLIQVSLFPYQSVFVFPLPTHIPILVCVYVSTFLISPHPYLSLHVYICHSKFTAGMPSCRELHGHLIAVHHSYAFSTSSFLGELAVWRLYKQTNKQLLQQGCGSKRRAIAFYFFIRIWYVFLTSRRREESDHPGLCMSSVLAKRMQLYSGNFRRILRPSTF